MTFGWRDFASGLDRSRWAELMPGAASAAIFSPTLPAA